MYIRQQQHRDECALEPSTAGIEHDPPSVVVGNKYILPHMVVDRHVLKPAVFVGE